MITLSKNDVNQIIIKEYPHADNKILANKLGIKEQTLRKKASKLGVRKGEVFMKEYYIRLQDNRNNKQKENYKDYKMTNIERNIIIGSLLGDGTLSKYGRSLNACYRENTGLSQKPYRKWKATKLKNLDFKINSSGAIYSSSHPIYTELYEIFYPGGKKIISKEGLKMLNHPIGLACLFMDDGSLVINNYKKSNNITLFPQIFIYSQSFTMKENILIKNHIKKVFDIELKLSARNDGSNYILKINKRNEVYKFINIIKPYVEEIPSMKYKTDIENKLVKSKKIYSQNYPNKNIVSAKKRATDNSYSKEDESKIIQMLSNNMSYKDIAKDLNRTYYGLYDKVRRMNKIQRVIEPTE